MAKQIKLTGASADEIRKEFEELLRSVKLTDGSIRYSKTFGAVQRKATLYFTNEAWQKMQALISTFDKEVGWHGVAYRSEDGTDTYGITDILVYPQEVTGATVNTDQDKYQMWLMSHEDDVFNNIRMQGHSHVNMGVTPSGVDNTLYERILDQLDDSMFYIFLIYNKRGDKTIKIYDLEKNILFETDDITVRVLDAAPEADFLPLKNLSDEENKALSTFLAEYRTKKRVDDFVKSAKALVQDRIAAPVSYQWGLPSIRVPSAAKAPVQAQKTKENTCIGVRKSRGRRKSAKGICPSINNACDDEDYWYKDRYGYDCVY